MRLLVRIGCRVKTVARAERGYVHHSYWLDNPLGSNTAVGRPYKFRIVAPATKLGSPVAGRAFVYE